MKIIAHIYTDFPTKFGIPRQSGLVNELKGRILFEPEFRNPEAFRGLEGFSHIWLIWKFSMSQKEHWSATVKPPRLGGKKKMGVFATRSPFRPNDIGLSSVRLDAVTYDPELGPILEVSGIDLMNHTPIYDIKPYLPYVDSHPDATEGFAAPLKDQQLQVHFPKTLLEKFSPEKQAAAIGILAQDPRPGYDHEDSRIYKIAFAGYDIHFQVQDQLLTVCDLISLEGGSHERQ